MKEIKRILLLIVLACTLPGYAFAQKGKLPFLNNISMYDVKSKSKISEMVVKVYNVTDNGGAITPSEISEPYVKIQFDALGNRIKEETFDNNNNKPLNLFSWDYNLKDGSVGQYQLDSVGEQVTKKTILVNKKTGSVDIKNYGVSPDTLLYDEFFNLGSTKKTINYERKIYDLDLNIVAQKTTRTYNKATSESIENIIYQVWGGADYSWLIGYMEDIKKANNKKTRTDIHFDNSKTVYNYNKKLKQYTGKEQYNIKGELVTKVIYQFDYDDNKNWIKAVETTNGKATAIIERQITYFPKK